MKTFAIIEGVANGGAIKTTVTFHGDRRQAQLALLRWLRKTAEQVRRAAK